MQGISCPIQYRLFQLFLYTTNKMEIQVKQVADDKYRVSLLNIDMSLPIEVVTDAGTKRIDIDKKGIEITSKTSILLDPKVYYLKKVSYE